MEEDLSSLGMKSSYAFYEENGNHMEPCKTENFRKRTSKWDLGSDSVSGSLDKWKPETQKAGNRNLYEQSELGWGAPKNVISPALKPQENHPQQGWVSKPVSGIAACDREPKSGLDAPSDTGDSTVDWSTDACDEKSKYGWDAPTNNDSTSNKWGSRSTDACNEKSKSGWDAPTDNDSTSNKWGSWPASSSSGWKERDTDKEQDHFPSSSDQRFNSQRRLGGDRRNENRIPVRADERNVRSKNEYTGSGKVCFNFAKGYCRWGSECRFIHDNLDSSSRRDSFKVAHEDGRRDAEDRGGKRKSHAGSVGPSRKSCSREPSSPDIPLPQKYSQSNNTASLCQNIKPHRSSQGSDFKYINDDSDGHKNTDGRKSVVERDFGNDVFMQLKLEEHGRYEAWQGPPKEEEKHEGEGLLSARSISQKRSSHEHLDHMSSASSAKRLRVEGCNERMSNHYDSNESSRLGGQWRTGSLTDHYAVRELGPSYERDAQSSSHTANHITSAGASFDMIAQKLPGGPEADAEGQDFRRAGKEGYTLEGKYNQSAKEDIKYQILPMESPDQLNLNELPTSHINMLPGLPIHEIASVPCALQAELRTNDFENKNSNWNQASAISIQTTAPWSSQDANLSKLPLQAPLKALTEGQLVHGLEVMVPLTVARETLADSSATVANSQSSLSSLPVPQLPNLSVLAQILGTVPELQKSLKLAISVGSTCDTPSVHSSGFSLAGSVAEPLQDMQNQSTQFQDIKSVSFGASISGPPQSLRPVNDNVSKEVGTEIEQEGSRQQVQPPASFDDMRLVGVDTQQGARTDIEKQQGKEDEIKIVGPKSDGIAADNERKTEKGQRLFRITLIELVKELLKPAWKEGHLTREVHKTIVKKVVDKVVSTLDAQQMPLTQQRIDQYLELSKPKLSKLVQAYVAKYVNS